MSTKSRDSSGPTLTLSATDSLTIDSRPAWDAEAIGRQTFRSPGIDWEACYVYIGWGYDRARPLYVGKSREPLNRIGRHLRTTAWASDVVDWELLAFDSEPGALNAEARAIHALNPIHNVARGGGGSTGARKWRRSNISRRRRIPPAYIAVPPPIHGISDDQLKIIRRVQGMGRTTHSTEDERNA